MNDKELFLYNLTFIEQLEKITGKEKAEEVIELIRKHINVSRINVSAVYWLPTKSWVITGWLKDNAQEVKGRFELFDPDYEQSVDH